MKHKQLSKSSIDTLDQDPDTGLAENSSSANILLNSTVFLCRYAGEELLPPASAVEVIESEPSFRVSVCVSVCEHSHCHTV